MARMGNLRWKRRGRTNDDVHRRRLLRECEACPAKVRT
jgi:hypothetical protein